MYIDICRCIYVFVASLKLSLIHTYMYVCVTYKMQLTPSWTHSTQFDRCQGLRAINASTGLNANLLWQFLFTF